MKEYILLLFLVLSSLTISGQSEDLPGQWRAYLPYNIGIDIAQNEQYIFYATPYALFSIDKKSDEITTMSKVEGLSDAAIQNITYDAFNKQLLICYKNSNMDVIKSDGSLANIPDIKTNTNITGDRTIRDVYIYDEELAFLSTSFGIIEFRLKALEFGSTIFTPVATNMIRSYDKTLYAATTAGLYMVKNDGEVNISDFSEWKKHTDTRLTDTYPVENVALFNDSIFISSSKRLYTASREEPVFERENNAIVESHKVAFFSQEQENLIVGLVQSDPFSKIMVVKKDGSRTEGGGNCINVLYDALEDENGKMWYADGWRGIRSTLNYTSGCDKLEINGPLSIGASDIEVYDGTVYVASGGASESYQIISNRAGFFEYKDGQWTNYTDKNVQAIKDNDFASIFQLEKQPNGPILYIGSFYNGLIAFNTETKEQVYYSSENSAIQNPINENDGERISGLAFDNTGNLWINSIYAERPLTVLTKDGKWYNYTYSGSKAVARCEIDDTGLMWSVLAGASGGVLIYDTNGTFDTDEDDQSRVLGIGNSALQSSRVTCITKDLNGDMWIGTDKGPVVFRGGKSVFDKKVRQGRRLKVVQNGIVGYLLGTQDIRAIEVDGANRKWIGTRNGLFVMSASGDEEIAYFNEENSPLLDNTIVDMSFDGSSGIMYISTEKGIVSYKTETSLGSRRHDSSSTYAYPNPVPADHQGNIYVKGLARDARVKITDLEGKLVYETTALGGTAVWNGRDYNNRKAAPGVYLVFSTVKINEKSDNAVTKIMLVE